MIYLDHASATPMKKQVIDAMAPFFADQFFNPSAPYLPAKRVREIYENAKDDIAHTIGAKGNDIIITAGATEANNLAFSAVKNSEVLVLETEHASVLNLAKNYKYQTIKVDKNGRIDLKDFQKKLTEKVGFVSVSLANNELGTIQPITEISEIIRTEKQKRLALDNPLPLIFHTDASQAQNLININVTRLGVDLMTINSAKVYGPKGVGALYIAHGVKLKPVSYGGGQEMGLRSGTENVAGVVGFAMASKLAKEHINGNIKKYEKLSKLFREELKKNLDGIIEPKFLGNSKKQLVNFVPVCFPGVDAERLIYMLEMQEIYASTGAACAASKGEKSHVLSAIGLTDTEITGSLRISIGADNTEDDIKISAKKIAEAVKHELARVNENTNKKTVFVGMSGGVDSSVSAKLLKDQGYHVVGIYMKNWSRDLPGMKCPWADDLSDAKRIAVNLDIDFKVFDFEKDYKQKVVDYMLDEFKRGRTPNPDIMCNQEIKFKLFYDVAREQGADFIATGHYAKADGDKLLRAKDENKDQTYFLYRISKDAIAHTIFPLGDMLKPDVKKLANEFGFHNAYKKESMGVCFVGEVGIKDFLKEYVKEKRGEIRETETDKVIGFHEGAIFYTVGQRHGLNIGGGLPYYVTGKDMKNNIVYVSKNLNNKNLWTKELKLTDVILRNKPSVNVMVRLRHRAPLIPAKISTNDLKNSKSVSATLEFEQEIKAPAIGQSAVIYDGKNAEICLGGGIISR